MILKVQNNSFIQGKKMRQLIARINHTKKIWNRKSTVALNSTL